MKTLPDKNDGQTVKEIERYGSSGEDSFGLSAGPLCCCLKHAGVRSLYKIRRAGTSLAEIHLIGLFVFQRIRSA